MAGRKPKSIATRAEEAGISEATARRRLAGSSPITREEKLKQEIRKLKAEADKAEKFAEMLEGDSLPRDVVAMMQARIAHVLNAFMRAAAAELPPLVAGLTPAKAEKVIREWIAPWAVKLADAGDAVWIEAHKATQRDMRGDQKKLAAAKARKRK